MCEASPGEVSHPVSVLQEWTLTDYYNSLQSRKRWILQKQRNDSVLDPSLPDGHVIMPNTDKINTLQILQRGMCKKLFLLLFFTVVFL